MNFFKWLFKITKAVLHEKSKIFIGGCFGGFVLWWNILFNDIAIDNYPLIIHIAKIIGALVMAFATGLVGALGKDAWEYIKANKKIKRQSKQDKIKNQNQKNEYKQIWGKNGKDTNGDHKNTA